MHRTVTSPISVCCMYQCALSDQSELLGSGAMDSSGHLNIPADAKMAPNRSVPAESDGKQAESFSDCIHSLYFY